jgi:hypothetical protein
MEYGSIFAYVRGLTQPLFDYCPSCTISVTAFTTASFGNPAFGGINFQYIGNFINGQPCTLAVGQVSVGGRVALSIRWGEAAFLAVLYRSAVIEDTGNVVFFAIVIRVCLGFEGERAVI